jgi:hypothetical protein
LEAQKHARIQIRIRIPNTGAKKEMNADFPAPYFTSILHFFLSSLYLNLFKGLGAGIVGEYGGMKKEKKEKENCVKKEMHMDFRPLILP